MTSDVLIIGGGPGGAACATLLARGGARVVALERERFPRFHIGESLLPCATPVLRRLGVDMASFLVKRGAEFLDEAGGQRACFLFEDALEGAPWAQPTTWQVERSRFDAQLQGLARAAGAEVREGALVRDVDLDSGEGVSVTLADGERLTARYLIDASGQQAFLARRHRTLAPYQGFGRAAVFCHVSELGPEARAVFEESGNIKILLVPDGWGWLIPLGGGLLSVGFVKARGKVTAETLAEGFAASPLLQRLTAGCPRSEPRRIGDFSYLNARSSGARWACVGDASCFLDPVFSSGVSLALLGAASLTDLLLPALAAGTEADPALTEPLRARLAQGYLTFAAFIHRFYGTRWAHTLFMSERRDPAVYRGIVSLLAGDVWRDDNPFQETLLSAARSGRRRLDWPPTLPGSDPR